MVTLEIVILAKCGAPMREAKDVKQIIYAPVRITVNKPDETRWPHRSDAWRHPRVEYSRLRQPDRLNGWIHAGFDVDGLDMPGKPEPYR